MESIHKQCVHCSMEFNCNKKEIIIKKNGSSLTTRTCDANFYAERGKGTAYKRTFPCNDRNELNNVSFQ